MAAITRTQEESAAAAESHETPTEQTTDNTPHEKSTQETTDNTPDTNKEKTTRTTPEESTRPEKEQVKPGINLLYEQCLGFVPGSLSGKRDPR